MQSSMDFSDFELSEEEQQLLRQLSADDASYAQLLKLFKVQKSNEDFWKRRYEEATSYAQQMFDNHQAIKLMIDPESGRIVNVNITALEFYGYTRKQMLGMRIQEINVLPPDILQQAIQQVLEGSKTYFEFQHRLASGEIRDVDVFSTTIDGDQGRLLYSTILDVSEVREAKKRYYALFEQSNDAVFILDLNGRHIQINQRAADLLGYTIKELTNMTFLDIVIGTEVQHSQNVLERLLAGERVPPYERVFRHRDGRHIHVEINVEVVYGHNNKPLHIQSVVRDISHRKEMELENQAFLDDMKALQMIHLELSEIDDLQYLYRRMIELTHERLNFDRIALFVLDEKGEYLLGTFGTDEKGKLRDESYYREPITDDHWTLDIVNAHKHTRLWDEANILDDDEIIGRGWKAASTLWDGHRAIGYLVCDGYLTGKKPRRYQEELLSILGSTFGHLIERKYDEIALQEREDRLRMILKGTRAGTWEWNVQTGETIFNERWAEIVGYTLEELEPINIQTWLDLCHPDDLDLSNQLLQAHFNGETEYYECEARMRTKTGEWIWVLDRGMVMEWTQDHKPLRMFGTHVEISERKQMELALKLREEQLHLMVNSMPLMIGFFDMHGHLQFTNHYWEDKLGWRADELIEIDNLVNMLFADGESRDKARVYVQSEAHVEEWVELRIKTKVQGYIDTAWAKVRLYDGRTIGIGQDITQRKLAQERQFEMALQEQRIQLLMTFIQNATHEFRTPLSIIGSSSYLMSRSDDPVKRQKKEQQIRDQIKRINRLVEMLLTMTKLERLEALKMESINVSGMLDIICDNMSSMFQHNIELVRKIDINTPRIIGAVDELVIAMEQIMTNAYRYTPEGGKISVSTGYSRSHVWIDITDTGIGIDEADKNSIFEYFWRKDQAHTTPGFGLGLSIARKVFELHRGTVSVHSEPNIGTTFHIELPIQQQDLPQQQP